MQLKRFFFMTQEIARFHIIKIFCLGCTFAKRKKIQKKVLDKVRWLVYTNHIVS